MNRSQFEIFVNRLNDVFPESYKNKTKNDILFGLLKALTEHELEIVFTEAVMSSNYPPSLNKIKECIEKMLGSKTSDREKELFIEGVSAGRIWCTYCQSAGMVEVTDVLKSVPGKPFKLVMRCGHCVAAVKLRISKDINEYFDLTSPVHYRPTLSGEKSPFLLTAEMKQRNAKLLNELLVELSKGRKGNLEGVIKTFKQIRKDKPTEYLPSPTI